MKIAQMYLTVTAPTLAGVMELIMRIFAAIILSKYLGFTGIAMASPLAWIGSCVPLGIAYYITHKKLYRLKKPKCISEK